MQRPSTINKLNVDINTPLVETITMIKIMAICFTRIILLSAQIYT